MVWVALPGRWTQAYLQNRIEFAAHWEGGGKEGVGDFQLRVASELPAWVGASTPTCRDRRTDDDEEETPILPSFSGVGLGCQPWEGVTVERA